MQKLTFNYGKSDFLEFEVKDGFLCLTACGGFKADYKRGYANPVQVHLGGFNQSDHHFSKHTGSSENETLKFVAADTDKTEFGDRLIITQQNQNVRVTTYYQSYTGTEGFRTWSRVKNISKEPVRLEYVSSFFLSGIEKNTWQDDVAVYIPHNYWKAEFSWKKYKPSDLGLYNVSEFSAKRIAVSNTGTMSTKEYLPMGVIEKPNGCLLWQIESSCSWNWEISTLFGGLYTAASGPSYAENGWYAELSSGEEFESCTAAVVTAKKTEGAFAALTGVKRAVRKDNFRFAHDVFFNDYMNCLDTDTTFEREIPVIDRAAELGCGYYMIDAGWYTDGEWYHNTGEWKESKERYKSGGGLKKLIDYIKGKGMVPGLWVEIEVVSIEPPYASTLPADWFFQVETKRIADNYRHMLNFGKKEVVEYADGIVKNLIENYGVGFIKMDHNINGGVGTDCGKNSVGEGLLRHARGYAAWIKSLKKRYPKVLFENCASGGCRMDYGLLYDYDLQSTSDQTEFLKYAPIAANAATAVLPEQAGVWCYPVENSSAEDTVFNMVNGMLSRIYLSGRPDLISDECFELEREGIEAHKKLGRVISSGKPIWPLGLAENYDKVIAFGIILEQELWLSVWNRESFCEIQIDLSKYGGISAEIVYPSGLKTQYKMQDGILKIIPHTSNFARFFKIKLQI